MLAAKPSLGTLIIFMAITSIKKIARTLGESTTEGGSIGPSRRGTANRIQQTQPEDQTPKKPQKRLGAQSKPV